MQTSLNLVELTAEIVGSYVSNNRVMSGDLPNLIQKIHGTLTDLHGGVVSAPPQVLAPAVNPRRSVSNEYIVCLEDGLKFKSLKRHIRSKYNLTPEEYRRKWDLPPDYPMVAPAYAKARSALAKKMGLGQKSPKA
ncbi:MAG: MucR family transcriptional regulator [Alphaproteobacteria bacterium]|nr:MucR family transcriptional regulator [Alphaproteobacteria bacterium]